MDILDQAIEFEYLGHKMYSDYAAAAASPAVRNIFEGLAEDELQHVEYLKALKNRSKADLKPTATMHRIREIIVNSSDDSFLAAEAGIKAALEKALEFENRARIHYEKELTGAENPEQKHILQIMADEEARHHDLIDSLLKHLEMPRNILESPEFHWYEI